MVMDGVVGGSNAPLLKIDTVVPNDSSGSNASTKSLAEYTLTLPGLTSKLAKVGIVEGTVNAGSVVVSEVGIVELIDSVVPFSVIGVVVLSVVTDNDDGITACVVVLGLEVVVSTETIVVDGTTVVVSVGVVGVTVVVGRVVKVGIVVLGILVVVSVTGLKVDDINLAREERVSWSLEPSVGTIWVLGASIGTEVVVTTLEVVVLTTFGVVVVTIVVVGGNVVVEASVVVVVLTVDVVTGTLVVDLVVEVMIGASIRFSAGVPVKYVVSLGVTTTIFVDSGSGVEVRELRSANNLPIVRSCNDCSSDNCPSTLTGSIVVLVTCATGREVVVVVVVVLLVLVLRGVVDLVTLDTDLVGVGVGVVEVIELI